jgi:hypothetical protein
MENHLPNPAASDIQLQHLPDEDGQDVLLPEICIPPK